MEEVSLTQASSVNPDRVVEYKNPTIYYINFGTYNGDFPEILNPGNLEMRAYNIKSRARFSEGNSLVRNTTPFLKLNLL